MGKICCGDAEPDIGRSRSSVAGVGGLNYLANL